MRRTPAAIVAATQLVAVSGIAGHGHAFASAPCPSGAGRIVNVASAGALRSALSVARPGDELRLADGVYRGHFTLTRKGLKAEPIVICGDGAAVLDGGPLSTGYTLHLANTAWVQVAGIEVRHAQKGVVVDASTHVSLTGLVVHDVGEEGVHLRRNTTASSVSASRIYDTGRIAKGFGEGVYIGSARTNWCADTGCQPDRTDSISVTGNTIGPGVPAEEVDVKEGTSNGVIADNTFDGTDMSAAAMSWVDVKGNTWTVHDNVGRRSRMNGFSDTLAVPGWGNRNVFAGNHATVDASGYGFKIAGGVVGVVVYTSNVVIAAGAGACNRAEKS